ncbi:class I SAM-dependent methyltransferase [Thioalkalivibrio sp. ALE11]|uniref:methyltransferase n=1 Tax=Thioalkalivibrio sp. ALE11 TaxID=1265494 RepID=UPI0003816FF3|nr:class I SAM-dependent methyltransferase [Thioalkalivibrio sp. ALE11]
MYAEQQPLREQAEQIGEQAWFRDVLRRHCPLLPAEVRSEDINTRIHPDDQMLLHSLRHHGDAQVALSQYYNVAFQQFFVEQQIINRVFGSTGSDLDILDFACGYGRMLRFQSLITPPERLHASEIQADAVDFVTREFGVQGLRSSTEPEQFEPGRRFDVIWVASLFSHLPEDLFKRWVRRLGELLSPRGILCFSVHDESLLPEGLRLPDSGILFGPDSEIDSLPEGTYGTTYVSEPFVADVLATAVGADRPWTRLPRALAHEQDVYVVPGTAARDLAELDGFRRGPWGWTDERRVDADGIYLRGWAASLDDGPPEHVNIRINGDVHRCPTGLTREDVAAAFHDPRLAGSGWEFHAPSPRAGYIQVEVSASSGTPGEKALLYTGLHNPLGQPDNARLPLRHRLQTWLRTHISGKRP